MNFVLRRRNPANTAGGGCVQHVHPLVMVTDAVDAVAAQAPKTGQVQPRSCPFRKNLCDSSPPHPGPQLPPAHPSDLACKPDTRWPARRSDCVHVQNSCAAHKRLVEMAHLGWVWAVVLPRWRGCVRDGGCHNMNRPM